MKKFDNQDYQYEDTYEIENIENKCRQCNQNHEIKIKNGKISSFFYCDFIKNPKLICRICGETNH